MEKKQGGVAAIVIAVVITALVVVGVMQYWQKRNVSVPVGQSGTENNSASTNCTQSSGTWSNNTCSCQKDDTYEDGYCITADGSPGGKIGQQFRLDLEAKMKQNDSR